MKNTIILFIIVILYYHQALSQNARIDNFNVYYGTLHNHSSFSADAIGNPEYAYTFARDSSKLDFFALTEHCIYLTQTEWLLEKQYADAQNRDSTFTALCGFEWTHSKFGHMIILNTSNFTTSTDSASNTFAEISRWISANNGISFFNHPGRQNTTGEEFSHFTDTPNTNIVGMELWNRTAGFATYYYNNGYYPTDNTLSFYDEANIRRWKIGASGSEDNHSATWGKASHFRLAILAKANTKSNILDAMRKRHFYSTLDKNIVLSFKLNNAQMGDSVKAGMLHLTIESFDTDNEYFNKVTLKKNGTIFKSWNVNTQHPAIHDSIWCSTGEYLYAVVTQTDGNEAISSPIYIAPFAPLIIRDSIIVRNSVLINKTIFINNKNTIADTIITTDTILNIDTISKNDTIILNNSSYQTDTIISTDTMYINNTMYVVETQTFKAILHISDTIYATETIRIYLNPIYNTSNEDITIFPNHFTHNIYVKNVKKYPLTIMLFSMQGNVLIKRKSNEEFTTIETSHIKAGTYIISITYGKKRESVVVSKKK